MLLQVRLYQCLYDRAKFSCISFIIDCSACKLEKPFTESNGYYCFVLNDDNVACTCPDQRYILNNPCRMIFINLVNSISTKKLTFFRHLRS
jgi:hypothetical protein